MKNLSILSLLVVVVLVIVQNVSGQFSGEAAKRGHKGHQIFRLKRGYHFFRLRKSDSCKISESAKSSIIGHLERGEPLCKEDSSFISQISEILNK